MTRSATTSPSPPNRPRILAIETSSAVGSVALAEGPDLVATQPLAATARHGQNLLPTIASLCDRAGWTPDSLRQIYVSIGPGSFTGLRIAVAAARSLAWALDLRVVGVPSLDVIAQNALDLPHPPEHLAVVLDAKRRQVYAALYRRAADRYENVLPAALFDSADFLRRAPRPLTLHGEGLRYHEPALRADDVQHTPESLWTPAAAIVHRLGWRLALDARLTPPRDLLPIYIRPPEAEEVWAARHDAAKP